MSKLNPVLRVIMFPVAFSMALTSVAFADDAGTKATTEKTHDVSKNPLTGSTTETTTTESQMKVGDATKTKKHVKKRKTSKDGSKVKEETENTTESH